MVNKTSSFPHKKLTGNNTEASRVNHNTLWCLTFPRSRLESKRSVTNYCSANSGAVELAPFNINPRADGYKLVKSMVHYGNRNVFEKDNARVHVARIVQAYRCSNDSASSSNNSCVDIVLKEVSALYPPAWVGSLMMAMTYFMSPIAGILIDRIGIQLTALMGSITMTVGMISSAYVPSIDYLYFTLGILFGTGTSLVYNPAIVILGQYFDKRMGIVNGIVCLGTSPATMFLPIILPKVRDGSVVYFPFRQMFGILSLFRREPLSVYLILIVIIIVRNLYVWMHWSSR